MYVFMQCFFVPFRVKAIYLSEKGNVDLLSYIFIYIFVVAHGLPGEGELWGKEDHGGIHN